MIFWALLAFNCSVNIVDRSTAVGTAANALVSMDEKITFILALLYFLADGRRHISTNNIADLQIV